MELVNGTRRASLLLLLLGMGGSGKQNGGVERDGVGAGWVWRRDKGLV